MSEAKAFEWGLIFASPWDELVENMRAKAEAEATSSSSALRAISGITTECIHYTT